MPLSIPTVSGRRLGLLLAVLATLGFAKPSHATAYYVYHERSSNAPCSAAYANPLNPGPGQTETLGIQVKYAFYTNNVRVYYTTDGSTPSGSLGAGAGTTSVVSGVYVCQDVPDGTDGSGNGTDFWTATIPVVAPGKTVKYIISAFNSSGGDEIFANGPGSPCNCGTPTTTAAQATVFSYTIPVVYINELQTGSSSSASDEFVELYNPMPAAQSIGGWQIRYASSAGGAGGAGATIPAGATIASKGYYLLASNVATWPNRDTSWTAGMTATAGQIGLFNAVGASGVKIDGVGYGTVTSGANNYYETSSFTGSFTTNQSIQRKVVGGVVQDTDVNSADFQVLTTPTPTGSLTKPAVTGVTVTPNPATAGSAITVSATITQGSNSLNATNPVTVDLSPVGGGTAVAMTTAGASSPYTYTVGYTLPVNLSSSTPTITVTAKDNAATPNSATGNTILTVNGATPPSISAVTITPSNPAPGQVVTVSATVTQGTFALAASNPVTANLSSLGGPAAVALTTSSSSSPYLYTASYTLPANLGGSKTVTASVTDSTGVTASASGTTHVAFPVIISQVYGGGGNSGAAYKNDFIELYNRSSAVQDISGFSVQYTSAAGTTWAPTTIPAGTLLAGGQYFLIQEQSSGTPGTALPTPDLQASTFNMSSSAGKVAFVASSTALSGSCATDISVVDWIGFGAADCFDTSHAIGAPTTAQSFTRSSVCIDTDDNGADFAVLTVVPHNRTGLSSLNITAAPSSAAKCVGDSVTFSVTATGPGTLTYAWRKNGVLNGATGSSYTINSLQATDAGSYSVDVTSGAGCGTQTSTAATLTVDTTPTVGTVTVTPSFIGVGQPTSVTVSAPVTAGSAALGSVVADLSAIGGSATQTLSLSGGSYSATATVTPSSTGSRTVTVTASGTTGCPGNNSTTVLVKTSPTVGSVAFSPVALSAGLSTTVTVTTTDGTSPAASVTVNLAPVGGTSVTLTGGPNTWTGTVPVAIGTAAGAKSLTVTAADSQGVSSTGTGSLTVNGPGKALAASGSVFSSPTAYSGSVYFGDANGRFYKYDVASGMVAGGYPMDTSVDAPTLAPAILSRPSLHVEGGDVFAYFTSSAGRVLKVDVTTNTPVWATGQLLNNAADVSTTPAVATVGDPTNGTKDYVFVAMGTGSEADLYKVDAATGSIVRSVTLPGTNVASSPAVGPGGVYIGLIGAGTARIQASDLTVLTQVGGTETVSAAPYIYGGGTSGATLAYPVMYIGTTSGNLYAVNATTGAPQDGTGVHDLFGQPGDGGKVTLAAGASLSSLYVYKDKIYAGAGNNKVYRLNASDGGSAGTFFDAGAGGGITDGIAIDPLGSGGQGNLLFGSTNHLFYQVPLNNPSGYSVYNDASQPYNTTPTTDATTGYNLAGNDGNTVYGFPRF